MNNSEKPIASIVKKDWLYLLLLSAIAVAFLFAIPFQGNFGLNDDPDYARAVKELAFEGKYYPENYASIMLTQLAYGAVFVKLFGFSHTILRVSVMLLSVLGILLFFVLARLFGFSQKHSLLVSLVLLTNPFFVVLGHSFMADVPFVFLIIAALLPLASWLKTNDKKSLTLGCGILLLAFFLKQWALLFFAGLAVFVFFARKNREEKLIVVLMAAIFAIALLWSLPHYALDDKDTYFKPFGGKYVLPLIFGLPFYIAMFLFPLSIIMLLSKENQKDFFARKKTVIFSALFAIAGIVAGLLFYKRILPYFSNVISPLGLGPKMLAGEATGIIPEPFWIAMTLLAAISLVFIFSSFDFKFFKKKENLLLSATAGVFFLQIMISSYFIDRYFLAIIPIILLVVMQPLCTKKYFTAGMIATIVFFGAFSFVFTSEYLAWNNTAWKLINELREQGIPADKIDGGMDYCRSTFGQDQTTLVRTGTKYYMGICGKGCVEPGYAIAFKPLPGCIVVKSEPYLVFGQKFGEIYLLKK